MLLKGSCHCGGVRFSVRSQTPYPYLWCYCSICRKTAGGGGYAINLMGLAETLKVQGRQNLAVYRARLSSRARTRSSGRRHFCRRCGSALWLWDPRWKHWIYPFASAIDSKLPVPKERQHIFLDSKPSWVVVPKGKGHRHFARFPREAIIDWHRRRGLGG
ncbi:MAG: GFA family protein [Betaproteobacteria bacterium]|nr:MAG: GFA family protein [Betaproteobacteria bacterium]